MHPSQDKSYHRGTTFWEHGNLGHFLLSVLNPLLFAKQVYYLIKDEDHGDNYRNGVEESNRVIQDFENRIRAKAEEDGRDDADGIIDGLRNFGG